MANEHDGETDSNDLFDFAMTNLNARPGPCKAALADEAGPVDMLGNQESIMAAIESREAARRGRDAYKTREVKHGSGKVKV